MIRILHILINLLLPVILCIINAYLTKENDYFFMASFVIIIATCNLKKSKYSIIKTFLLSFLISLLVIGISIICYFISGYIIDLLTDYDSISISNSNVSLVDLTYLIQIALISPILFFYGFKFVLKINFTGITLLIIFLAIILIFIVGFTPLKYEKKYFFDIYVLWQIIIAFAIQLILYQDELKLFFTKDK